MALFGGGKSSFLQIYSIEKPCYRHSISGLSGESLAQNRGIGKDTCRKERDQWSNWSGRVASLAAKTGVNNFFSEKSEKRDVFLKNGKYIWQRHCGATKPPFPLRSLKKREKSFNA